VGDGFLDAVERGLVRRALFDLDTAATTLRHVGDTQNTIFQVHQAAEKFLKVALKRAGSTTDLKRLGHKLPAVFAELKSRSGRYSWLESSVDALQALVAPNMQIRYAVVPRRLEDAVQAFHAALRVCGALARMWLFDARRGSDDSRFSPGRFYRDGSEATFFCKKVLHNAGGPDSAVLTRFGVYPVIGRLMLDICVPSAVSALYLEVTGEQELAVVQREFDSYVRNPPAHRATPEEVGIKIDSGPEGSYTTALFGLKS
jgi:HEPN domain-containing protein